MTILNGFPSGEPYSQFLPTRLHLQQLNRLCHNSVHVCYTLNPEPVPKLFDLSETRLEKPLISRRE
jgi:hypothetical protein